MFLTRSLIEGPHPLIVPIPFSDAVLSDSLALPKFDKALWRRQIPDGGTCALPPTRWRHQHPSTPSDWFMLWPSTPSPSSFGRDRYIWLYDDPAGEYIETDWDATQYLLLVPSPRDQRRPCSCPCFLLTRIFEKMPKLVLSLVASFLQDDSAMLLLAARRAPGTCARVDHMPSTGRPPPHRQCM